MAKPLVNILYKRSKVMTKYDNSKTFFEFEMQRKTDRQKELAIELQGKEIDQMTNLIKALIDYLVFFGDESNVKDECKDLLGKVTENRRIAEKFRDMI